MRSSRRALLLQTANGNVEAKVVCFYRRRDISSALIALADKHASESGPFWGVALPVPVCGSCGPDPPSLLSRPPLSLCSHSLGLWAPVGVKEVPVWPLGASLRPVLF